MSANPKYFLSLTLAIYQYLQDLRKMSNYTPSVGAPAEYAQAFGRSPLLDIVILRKS
ncbi:MAG: hypothetical protein F6K39_36005 [Okeania sp. SIO3B3]|nr:hypothetical protein [Okeania sp. SIO3B3]